MLPQRRNRCAGYRAVIVKEPRPEMQRTDGEDMTTDRRTLSANRLKLEGDAAC